MSENLSLVSSPVISPLRTNLQDLPFEDLEWEKFERLCLALVQKEFKIYDCEPLGTKGQKQNGIIFMQGMMMVLILYINVSDMKNLSRVIWTQPC